MENMLLNTTEEMLVNKIMVSSTKFLYTMLGHFQDAE